MAFDGFTTKVVVNELNSKIINSKIDKIYEPDKNTIILCLYSQEFREYYKLTICIDSHNYRINLSEHQKSNPLVAPNFCMLLRKHLLNGKIVSISMNNLERLVTIGIEFLNEFNELETKKLIVELMGKHSNIILIGENNIIIDALRRTDTSNNSYRDILPSRLYTFPKENKLDFVNISYDDFCSTVNSPEDIYKSFAGFSKAFVNYSVEKIGNNLSDLYNYFKTVLNNISNCEFVLFNNDFVTSLPKSSNNSVSHFVDDFYFERELNEQFTNYRNTILRLILDSLKKYNNRLVNINSKLNECNDMDMYKLYGELITSNLYRLSNLHVDSIELENYYDNNNLIKIPLDIKFTPSINAKHYFKKYNKLKNALKIVSEQKKDTISDINYLESVVFELEDSSSLQDIQDIFEEISESSIFKDILNKKSKKKDNIRNKKKKFNYSPIEYNIDGFKVYVGRNNKENDWLSLKFANPDDIWFHTKDSHGSHVILRVEKNTPSDDILVKCAKIAAQHSKASNSSNVPVDYCLAQFVKKPKGVKPGMVIFTHNKTLNVNPLE